MSDEPIPQRKMVQWLAPSVLAHSALEVAFSSLFANFADKREQMAGLSDEIFTPRDESDPFWFDYASDVGDGFGPTYTVASMIARDSLNVRGIDAAGKERKVETTRGRLLVLGGDEVYPSAKWSTYQERFTGPYAAALRDPDGPGPYCPAQRPQRALRRPGQSRLVRRAGSFTRMFCQDAAIGGWQTRQKRSYFAIDLPHGWWLWGIDIQFDAYIDGPQLEYFTQGRHERLQPGDRVILATAKPSWVKVPDDGPAPQSWQSLAYLDKRLIRPKDAELALTITGDLHHYSRYSPVDGAKHDKVTAGGGGAYLSPTHWLPPSLELPSLDGKTRATHRLGKCWPDAPASKRLRWGILRHLMPWVTPTLNLVLIGISFLFALLLAAGVKDQATGMPADGSWELIGDSVSLWLVFAVLPLGAALVGWAVFGDAPWLAGVIHAVVQFCAVGALTLFGLAWNPLGVTTDGFWLGYVTVAAVGLIGGTIVGRWLLVLYLLTTHLANSRWHANEVFAAQSRKAGTRYKHFVRFRIDENGLKLYVIGVESVSSGWSTSRNRCPTTAGARSCSSTSTRSLTRPPRPRERR